jgi:hypothetical protein
MPGQRAGPPKVTRSTGQALGAIAANGARHAGCEWLHVDFEEHLRPFYLGGCGFTPASAGLIALHREP